MNDHVYLRTNFSSATAPASSGARIKNARGDEYARIPLQLPGNIVDATDMPSSLSMLLTKLSIPLGRVPITQIPFKEIRQTDGNIVTQCVCTVWPFRIDCDGGITPTSYPTTIFNKDIAEERGYDYWPIQDMTFPIQSIKDSAAYNEQLREMSTSGLIDVHSIDELTAFLSHNFTRALYNVLYYSIENRDNLNTYYVNFEANNSRLQLSMQKLGGTPDLIIPFTDSVFNENAELRSPFSPNPAYIQRGDSTVDTLTHSITGISFVGNRYLRDLFPNLPWIKIDPGRLSYFDQGHGQEIDEWEQHCNCPEDTSMYVLDTTHTNFDWGADEQYVIRSGENVYYTLHNRPAQYHFDSMNLISLIPVSAFVVMLNGMTVTPQTFPVNINPRNISSSQITSVPIIEVYYPLWTSIDDLTTSMVVSKDAFSNAAPFMLTPDALRERNLVFEVYYVTNDGALHLLTIPPGTAITLQICYSISY